MWRRHEETPVIERCRSKIRAGIFGQDSTVPFERHSKGRSRRAENVVFPTEQLAILKRAVASKNHCRALIKTKRFWSQFDDLPELTLDEKKSLSYGKK